MKYVYAKYQIDFKSIHGEYVDAVDTTDLTYDELLGNNMTKRFLAPVIGIVKPGDKVFAILEKHFARINVVGVYEKREDAVKDIEELNTTNKAESIITSFFGLKNSAVHNIECEEMIMKYLPALLFEKCKFNRNLTVDVCINTKIVPKHPLIEYQLVPFIGTNNKKPPEAAIVQISYTEESGWRKTLIGLYQYTHTAKIDLYNLRTQLTEGEESMWQFSSKSDAHWLVELILVTDIRII